MTAEFFTLALVAALNPKLLAIDLLLIENRRTRAMFLCLLAGRPDRGPHDRPLLLGAYMTVSGLVRLS